MTSSDPERSNSWTQCT